jgi:hypothetical protein
MLNIAVDFYKNLFGKEPDSEITIDSDFWGNEEKLANLEKDLLERPFSENVIKEAVFEFESRRALMAPLLYYKFYQHFPEVFEIYSGFFGLVIFFGLPMTKIVPILNGGNDLAGDPLAPLLFNLVADVYTGIQSTVILLLAYSLLPCAGGVIFLQYADDTILFLENNFGKAKKFKWLWLVLKTCQA